MSRAASTIEENETYFTADEVVTYCHEKRNIKTVKPGTIRRATYEGDRPLRRTKIGGRVLYAQSDVDRWIASCKQ